MVLCRMAIPSVRLGSLRIETSRCGSLVPFVLFGLVALAAAAAAESPALAIYALSFWHYYLYWLAFSFRAVAFDIFKRDAAAMKTVSVAAIAAIYLTAPLDVISLAVIAGGIALNVRAAVALGWDRTYYGQEVAGLPPLRITAFPYSLTAHPMILGNVAAFGGTLINADFRQHWWPLAAMHVALNVGLLVLELSDRRPARLGLGLVFVGCAIGAAAVPAASPSSLLVVAAATVCAAIAYRVCTPRPGTAAQSG